MKNELMFHYQNHPLPSKKPEYIPYIAEEFKVFAAEKNITCAQLELWVDKSMATDSGKEWLEGRTKALNKTFDPNDYPEVVKSMWERFMNAHSEETVEAAIRHEFEENYYCRMLDNRTWDISTTLSNAPVKAWRGEGKTHMYFWFLFKVGSLGTWAMILESQKLQKVFDALEYFDPVDKRMAARSHAVLITDARILRHHLPH